MSEAHAKRGGSGGRSAPGQEPERSTRTLPWALGVTTAVVIRRASTCLALASGYAVLIGVSSAIGRTISIEIDPTHASRGELFAAVAAGRAGLATLLIVGIFVLPPTLGTLSLLGSAAVAHDELETHRIFKRVFERSIEVIGTFVVTVLALPVAAIVIGIVGILAGLAFGPEPAFAALTFMTLVLSVPTLYVLVRSSLAVPAVIREGLDPIDALRRSWELASGTWWWVFGVSAPGIVVMVVSLSAWAGLFGEWNFALTAVVSAALSAVAASLLGVAAGVSYEVRAEVKPLAELALPDAPGPQSPRSGVSAE